MVAHLVGCRTLKVDHKKLSIAWKIISDRWGEKLKPQKDRIVNSLRLHGNFNGINTQTGGKSCGVSFAGKVSVNDYWIFDMVLGFSKSIGLWVDPFQERSRLFTIGHSSSWINIRWNCWKWITDIERQHFSKTICYSCSAKLFDSTRAPEAKHTGWHMSCATWIGFWSTEAIWESSWTCFAPGFKDLILARHTFNSTQLQQHNENY